MNGLRALVLLVGLGALLVGCPAANACVPGATQACLCVGGGMGVQLCADDGAHFGACQCAGIDGGSGTDGGPGSDAGPGTDMGPGVDAGPGVDGGSGIDAGGTDGGPGVDASVEAVDANVVCPLPFVVCGGACLDPRTTPAFCGASGACTGASAGESCGGACAGGRCVWDSCNAAFAAGRRTDGLYAVDFDGSGPLTAADAYCDMTTPGGGWTLVYKIRNDIPDISDPFWGMVDLGSGTVFPTTLAPVPSGSHFEGPTREARAAYAARVSLGPAPRVRATLIRASDGTALFDLSSTEGIAISFVAAGTPGGSPSAATPFGSYRPVVVYISSAGFPAVGTTTGFEQYNGCGAGTCSDYAYVAMGSVSGPGIAGIFGDTSMTANLGPVYANTTTLFWVAPYTP